MCRLHLKDNHFKKKITWGILLNIFRIQNIFSLCVITRTETSGEPPFTFNACSAHTETIRTRSMMFDFHQTYPPDPFPTKETNYWPNVEIFSELAGSVHDTRHRKYKYEKGQSGIGIKWLAKRTNLENASSLAHNVSIVRSQAMPPIVDDFSNFFSFYFFLFPFR